MSETPWYKRWWLWLGALLAAVAAWFVTTLTRRTREAEDRKEAAIEQRRREIAARQDEARYRDQVRDRERRAADILRRYQERHRAQTIDAKVEAARINAEAEAAGSTAVLYDDDGGQS